MEIDWMKQQRVLPDRHRWTSQWCWRATPDDRMTRALSDTQDPLDSATGGRELEEKNKHHIHGEPGVDSFSLSDVVAQIS